MKESSIPHVTHVVSNLKSPNNKHWSIDLGPRTLIVGSNTSHKSTVVQAVELALSGAADDLIGRNAVKDGATLLTMAASTSLLCKLVLSNNDTRSYFVEAVDDTVKKPIHTGDPATLPLRLVRDALSGSSQTARRAFFEWVVGDDPVQFSSNHSELYLKLKEELGRSKTDAQTALAVLDYVSKKQRSLAQEIKGARSVREGLQQEAVEPPSKDELDAARADLMNCVACPADLEDRLRDAQQSLSEWSDRVDALQMQCAEENVIFYSSAKQLLDVAVFSKSSDCPLCASTVGSDHLRGCRQHYAEALTHQEPLLSQLADAKQTAFKWSSEVERLETMSGGGGDITEAQAEYDKLQNAFASWDALLIANKIVQGLEHDIEACKELKSWVESQINSALADHLPAFCEAVSIFLPWEFKIILRDNGRDVLRVGLVRDGQFYAALSGAEWAAVTAAIAMAVTSSSDAPRVLIPEDRAWDSRTLASVMKSFSEFDGQVIMTSTVRPRGRPHSSWTVIDLDADPLIKATPAPKQAPMKEPVRRSNGVVLIDSTARLLRGLGYNAVIIERMAPETAAQIAQEGLLAEYTDVHEDGSFSVEKKEDIMDLPRLQP